MALQSEGSLWQWMHHALRAWHIYKIRHAQPLTLDSQFNHSIMAAAKWSVSLMPGLHQGLHPLQISGLFRSAWPSCMTHHALKFNAGPLVTVETLKVHAIYCWGRRRGGCLKRTKISQGTCARAVINVILNQYPLWALVPITMHWMVKISFWLFNCRILFGESGKTKRQEEFFITEYGF